MEGDAVLVGFSEALEKVVLDEKKGKNGSYVCRTLKRPSLELMLFEEDEPIYFEPLHSHLI